MGDPFILGILTISGVQSGHHLSCVPVRGPFALLRELQRQRDRPSLCETPTHPNLACLSIRGLGPSSPGSAGTKGLRATQGPRWPGCVPLTQAVWGATGGRVGWGPNVWGWCL